MTDRRADARDARFGDFGSSVGRGRDDDDRVGRSSLFDFEDAEPEGRRDPYAEWLKRGSTPADHIADDWPEMPTQIGDWRFLTDSSITGSVTWGGYGVVGPATDLSDRVPRVTFRDLRDRSTGEIQAFVVTDNVDPAGGAPTHPPVVTADRPDAFARRVVSYLDGIQPDDAVHPRYDPLLERNLPDPWEFNGLKPLATKTTYRWTASINHDGQLFEWQINAEGSTNRRMDVFAFPIPSLGERAPRSYPGRWGIDPMPGEGAGPATETARRMMRAINESPSHNRGSNRTDEDRTQPAALDSLRFSGPDMDPIEFFRGDIVRAVYTASASGTEQIVGGELVDWGRTDPDRNTDEPEQFIEIETHDNGIVRIVGTSVRRGGRKVGQIHTTPPIALTRRGDR